MSLLGAGITWVSDVVCDGGDGACGRTRGRFNGGSVITRGHLEQPVPGLHVVIALPI